MKFVLLPERLFCVGLLRFISPRLSWVEINNVPFVTRDFAMWLYEQPWSGWELIFTAPEGPPGTHRADVPNSESFSLTCLNATQNDDVYE